VKKLGLLESDNGYLRERWVRRASSSSNSKDTASEYAAYDEVARDRGAEP